MRGVSALYKKIATTQKNVAIVLDSDTMVLNLIGDAKNNVDEEVNESVGFDKSAMSSAIESRRKALGLTQSQLAELVGVHYTRVSAWENGEGSTPSAENIFRLAEALGCTPNDLFSPTVLKPVPMAVGGRDGA